MNEILGDYIYLNECVKNSEVPERGGTNKSQPPCRWCGYTLECYN